MQHLVERREQLDALLDATVRARDTAGEVALVYGEAGAGKTSLLAEFVSNLPHGSSYAWGSCDALHTPRPLGPLYDMAASFGPEFRTAMNDPDRRADLFLAVTEAINRLGEGAVLIFEDTHWADLATLDLLKYLCRRILALKVLVIISYRNDEVTTSHPLATLIGDLPARRVNRIEVPCLSLNGVREMAEQAGFTEKRLYELTGGNPFFLTEILTQPLGLETQLPRSVGATIATRIARLSPGQAKLVVGIAAIPYSLDRELLKLIETEIGHSLSPLTLETGLFRETANESISFRHELSRLGVLSLQSKLELQRLFARLLNALIADEQLLDHHLDLAAHFAIETGDPAMILHLSPQAARRAAALGAHREAVEHFAQALRFIDLLPKEEAAALFEDWAYECGIADQVDNTVIAAWHEAIKLWGELDRPDKVGHNYRWLWRLHWYRGEAELADEAARASFEVLEKCPPSAELAMAYSTQSQLHFLNNRSAEAIEWGQRALVLAEQVGDLPTKIHAMTNMGSAMLFDNDQNGQNYMEQSLDLALRNNLHEHAAPVYTNYAEFAILARKFDLAEKLTSEGIAFDTRLTLDSWKYYLVGRQAQLRLEQGRLHDAETIASGVLSLDKLTKVMRLPALIVLARARSRMGMDNARDLLAEALDDALSIGEPQNIIPVRFALLEYFYLGGHKTDAIEQLSLIDSFGERVLQPWDLTALAVWAHRLGRPLPWGEPALSFQMGVAELQGRPLDAATEWSAAKSPYDAAMARLHYRGTNQADEMLVAIESLESIGANAAVHFARTLASECGLELATPKRRRGPYKASRSHPLGLTAREVQILELIVDGNSNRDIAEKLVRSQRTVEHHVAAVLGKLNAGNRMQAMLRVVSEPWILDQMQS